MEKEGYVLAHTFQGVNGEYLLKTAYDGEVKAIHTKLYKDGEHRWGKKRTYNGTNEEEKLIRAVQELHRSVYEDFRLIMQLVDDRKNCGPMILSVLVNILIIRGLYEEALAISEDISSAENIALSNDRLHYIRGQCYYHLGLYEESVQSFGKALKMRPNYVDYLNALGEAYLELPDILSSYKCFEKAVRENIYFAKGYLNLAFVLLKNFILRIDFTLAKAFPENCLEYLEKAAELNPSFKTADFASARTCLHEKEWKGAWEYLSKIRKSNNAGDNFDRGIIWLLFLKALVKKDIVLQELLDAICDLETMSERYLNYPDVMNELGVLYFLLAKKAGNDSIRRFHDALKLNPNYSKAQRNLKLVESETLGYELIIRAMLL